jgi:hypothetical protein
MHNMINSLIMFAVGCAFAYSTYASLRTGRMTVGALDFMTFTRKQRPNMFRWFIAIQLFAVVVCTCGAVGAFLHR